MDLLCIDLNIGFSLTLGASRRRLVDHDLLALWKGEPLALLTWKESEQGACRRQQVPRTQ